MTPRHLVLAAGAAVLLAACSVGKPVPQATTYVIEAATPEPIAAAPRIPETLRMGNVRMAAAFSGNLLVYRMDDVNFVSDPYQTFIADPGSMLGNVMATWLNRSGVFKSVTQPGSTQSAPYVLEATVTELYGDFRSGKSPAAVIAIQFALVDQTGVRPKIVYEGTIDRRETIAQALPGALVRGYGKAMSEILTQLVADIDPKTVRPAAEAKPVFDRR